MLISLLLPTRLNLALPIRTGYCSLLTSKTCPGLVEDMLSQLILFQNCLPLGNGQINGAAGMSFLDLEICLDKL